MRLRLLPLVISILGVHCCCRAADAGSQKAQDDPGRSSGRLKGTIRYQASPERPWRLSRYYIKDSKQGLLAEAVVALRGSQLTNSPASLAPGLHAIDQMNFMFVPETVAIRAGDRVTFTNSDESIHNVMTNDGGTPFNVNMAKGDKYTHTFRTPGGLAKPIRLGCVYHGGMRGWIYVFDHPFFQVTGAEGRFEFVGVPPGEYTLEVIHPAGRLTARKSVTVGEGELPEFELVLEARAD